MAASKHELESIQAHYAPGEITHTCDRQIARLKTRLDSIAALSQGRQGDALFEFESAMADFGDGVGPLFLMGNLHPDAGVCAEGSACEEKCGQFLVEVYTRKDIYDVIKKHQPPEEAAARLYEKTVEAFEMNGLGLPAETLENVRKLKKRLSGLEVKFGTNLNQDKSTMVFSAQELEGAPKDFLGRLERTADGNYVVTMKYPDCDAVMRNVKSGDTRRRMRLAFQNRGKPEENTELLEEAISVRQQIAKLSGYDSWADYRTRTRMAKNAANVEAFIAKLSATLVQKCSADLSMLLEFKRTLEPEATAVEWWDVPYLENQLKKTKYQLDDDVVREYFPLDSVMDGLFSIFSTAFGVHFGRVENAAVWHSDVLLYCVADSQSGQALGYLYLDLFPRQGKFGHEALFPVVSGRLVNGEYTRPVAVIAANKNPATSNGKPALLTHPEVVSMFHEFGHALHALLSRAPYASLSGCNTAWDFMETPSQTLERWPHDARVLDLLSGHYSDRSRKLPARMRDTIIELRDFCQGYFYAILFAYSEFDLKAHRANGPVDVTALAAKVCSDYTGLSQQPGTHFPATFGHIMGAYDAGYYSYAWSRVFAIDCFAQFEKEGLFNSETGARFRRWILEKGDMQDGDRLLEGFLGRPANADAFYRTLNITVEKPV